MDRTVVFDLIQQHVAILSADQHPSLLENKTSFMHVVLMYEHYLPMCLPLPTTIVIAVAKTTGGPVELIFSFIQKTSELTVTNPLFLERHGLLSLLMSEVPLTPSLLLWASSPSHSVQLPKHLSEHVLDRPKRSTLISVTNNKIDRSLLNSAGRPFLMFLQVIKALFRKVFFDERHANMKLYLFIQLLSLVYIIRFCIESTELLACISLLFLLFWIILQSCYTLPAQVYSVLIFFFCTSFPLVNNFRSS
jgi:hypothetical protein